ncbi:prepilin-type N-terminal cleavage/methylation domain-containing protein [Synechococcus sp. Cu2B8-bc1011]|uniref:type II secretion system protein n=1 Tax=Synechococcus sp. Cu2B8-bc1011 TaxID=3093725 RepID=UPI0039AF03FB
MKKLSTINTSERNNKERSGFTLIECIATVAIVGILSSIALPNYMNQVNRTRQNETASVISQIQTTIAAYADEFGVLPTSWADLNNTNAIMTENGPATSSNFSAINLAGGFYNAAITHTDNLFTITATRDDVTNLNVIACINLTNGASGINQGKGTADTAATTPNCG